MNQIMKSLLLCVALVTAPVFAEAPYQSVYNVQWKGLSLGDGRYTLTALAEKDCYRFESKTNPIGPVRWLYGTPYEMVTYCIKDGVVRPIRFEYVIDKREKDNFTLDFNWETRKVRSLKRGVITESDLPETAYDRFSMQQAIRLWATQHAKDEKWEPMIFNMVDDDARVIPYRFEIKGIEKVKTATGEFETLRVERTDRPDKSLRSWLSPAQDYRPMVVEHVRKGEVEMRMELIQ